MVPQAAVEDIQLVHEGAEGPRLIVGQAQASKMPNGNLTVTMRLHPSYSHLRSHFRNRIEDYMDIVPWYRHRTHGDRNG